MRIRTYLDIYYVILKSNWVRQAVYRANFLTSFLVDFAWIVVEFSLFTVIYSNVQTLGDWRREQVYFLLGIVFASDALFATFFQPNFWELNRLVNRGDLDALLTKPVSAVYLACTRRLNFTSVLNFTLGIAILVRYAEPAGFAGGWLWLAVAGWIGLGIFAQFLLRFLFSVTIFWMERNWPVVSTYYQIFALANKPDTIFPPLVRYALLMALPFGLIGSIPARALLHGISVAEATGLGCALVVLGVLDVILWRAGLRRYQSASS